MTIKIKIEIWVYVGCDWVFVFMCFHMGFVAVVVNFGNGFRGFGYDGGLLWLVVAVASDGGGYSWLLKVFVVWLFFII